MNKSVSVIIAPTVGLGSGLRGQVLRWTSLGLVRSSYWLDPSAVSGPGTAPRFDAVRLGEEGELSVELLDSLAHEPVTLIRLVALVPVGALAEPSTPVMTALRTLSDVLRSVVPRVDSGGGASIEVAAVKLVIPTSDAADADIQQASEGWAATLVVAPEGRPSPTSIGTFVWADTNWTPHAVSALATVAGLWPGVEAGVAEELTGLGGSAQPDTVRVIRSYTRSTTSPESTRDFLGDAVGWASGIGRLPVGFTSGLTPSLRDDSLVASARSEIVKRVGHELTLRPYIPQSSPPKRSAGWEAFTQLARFSLWCLAMLVRVTADAVIEGAGKSATRMTYGASGTTDVRFKPGRPSSMERVADDEINAVLIDNADLIRRAEGTRQPIQTPQAWRALRSASFDLVDGASPEWTPGMTSSGDVEIVSRRERVVTHTRSAVELDPDLHDLLELPLNLDHVSSHDPEGTRKIQDAVQALRTHLERRRRTEQQEGRDEGSNGSVAPVDGGSADSREPWDDVPVDETLQDLDDLDSKIARVTAGVESSLVGQLLQTCGDGVRRAEASLTSLKSRASAGGSISAGRVARARVRYLVAGYLMIALVVYSGIAWWRSLYPYNLESLDGRAWKVFAGTVLLAVVVLAIFIQNYFSAHSRFQRELTRACHELRESAAECASVVAESSRLTDVYQQMRDWAEIISLTIHEPYARPDGVVLGPVSLPEAADIPKAVQITQSPPREPSPKDTALVARMSVHQGWASEVFERLANFAFEEQNMSGAEGIAQADTDVPSAPNYAREHLLDKMRARDPQAANTVWLRDKVALGLEEARAQEALELEDAGLSPVEQTFLSAIAGPPTLFALNAWTSEAQVDSATSPESCLIWAPAGLKVHDLLRRLHVTRTVASGRVTTTVVRCDYSYPVPPRHLRFVALDETSPEVVPPSWDQSDF